MSRRCAGGVADARDAAEVVRAAERAVDVAAVVSAACPPASAAMISGVGATKRSPWATGDGAVRVRLFVAEVSGPDARAVGIRLHTDPCVDKRPEELSASVTAFGAGWSGQSSPGAGRERSRSG